MRLNSIHNIDALEGSIQKTQSEVYNEDCMVGMKQYPDKYFDLAICDPPYFDGPQKLGYYGERRSTHGVKRVTYKKIGKWKVPGFEYYNELLRVSKHQIIWGINYFEFSNQVVGRIVWDKVNDQSSFSKCEIASCSLIETVQQFRYMWSGMMQGKSISEGHIMQGNKKLNEKRIHSTQKPVALYRWLINKYAKQGFKILDTHIGSGSSRIAADIEGMCFVGFEIDTTCFNNQEKRFIEYKSQLKLF